MHVSGELTRRLQILVDEARYERLEHLARQRGTSVATVVRDAIDATYPPDADDRGEAARQLLSAEPIPVDDWASIKSEIEDSYRVLAE
jgi:hypothetical protein